MLKRDEKKKLQRDLENKQDDYEQVQTQMKSQLQKVNIEAERYQQQIQLLNDKQKEE